MRVLSMNQVCVKTSYARATLYRKLDPKQREYYDPTFPKPFNLSERRLNKKGKMQAWNRLGFLESEVDAWIADRAKKRNP